ncbi:MAG: HipA domain-containing protein [Bacteroidota bacterium]
MKEVQVVADWAELPTLQVMGMLRIEQIRGKEVCSFAYDQTWLINSQAQVLDPDLQLYRGPQYAPESKDHFGLFLDSSPDRWGRMLMDRREALLAKQEARPISSLLPSDYLLGIQDESRMGALRFRQNGEAPFLANEPNMTAPPFTKIRELEQASLRIEDDDFFEDQQAMQWLRLLIAPGSSLGGARPKANVRDAAGRLWIAKFPSKNDDWDSGAWEYVAHQLAEAAGIAVAPAETQIFSQQQHTFLVQRFDRNADDRRIHFASAMTLLGHKDGYNHQSGGSYLELVELLESIGATPHEDIRELWKRIVFSVLVSNTDDHLRNHGFLLTSSGWRLSPAYDLNPNPKGAGLSLNISEMDNRQNLELCLEVSPFFRWKEKEAIRWIKEAQQLVGSWEERAKALTIPAIERRLMEPAFRLSR